MSNNVRGIVQKINKNDNGFYSVKMGDEWFGAGKYAPKYNEGDEVSFDFTENGKYKNLTSNTVKVIETAPPQQSGNNGANSAGMAKVDWDGKDKRITFLACRKDAIAIAELALASDSLTLPAKKNEKYDALLALISDLSNSLYQEVYDSPFKE